MTLQENLIADQAALDAAHAVTLADQALEDSAAAKVAADNAAIAAVAPHLTILDNIEAELTALEASLATDVAVAFDAFKVNIGALLAQARALLSA